MKFPYKGIFAFCSAVCLFAVSMPISTVAASAETSPRKAVQADCVSDFADADSEDGYLPLQGAAIAFENSDGEQPLYGSAAETDTVPESYDLLEQGIITSVKDQGSDGMCWAFATLGAAESHLLKYYETDLDNINDMDLSEEQVGYFLYTPDKLVIGSRTDHYDFHTSLFFSLLQRSGLYGQLKTRSVRLFFDNLQ